MTQNTQRPELSLSKVDIQLILKALSIYDQHVVILNSGVFPISEDDLSDLNNDTEYMRGLQRMLEGYLQRIDK